MRRYVVDRHQTWEVLAEDSAHAIEIARGFQPDTDELTATALTGLDKVEVRGMDGSSRFITVDGADTFLARHDQEEPF